MGNAQATPTSTGIPVESHSNHAAVSGDAASGVRISGQAVLTLEDKLKEAYEQGKQDGVATFQSTLEVVAAQVYDNVHTQLASIQKDSVQQSQQLSKELSAKLSSQPSRKEHVCSTEKLRLADCLKDHKANPLACDDLVQAYSNCATSLI